LCAVCGCSHLCSELLACIPKGMAKKMRSLASQVAGMTVLQTDWCQILECCVLSVSVNCVFTMEKVGKLKGGTKKAASEGISIDYAGASALLVAVHLTFGLTCGVYFCSLLHWNMQTA
jgi:hypothetical protein